MKINKRMFLIISLVLIITTILTIAIKPEEKYETSNDDTNYNNYNYETKLNTSYLRISNVTMTSNSSYNVCNGSISVSSSSPYKYHYIKVKVSFMNSYGSVIDTDWTYAIGSEWLEPGESTKFRASVSKDSSITKCTATIMED